MGFLGDVGLGFVEEGFEAAKDYVEQGAEAVGIMDKPKADISMRNGKLDHNIDFTGFKPEQKAQAEQMLAQYATAKEDLTAQLAEARANGDSAAAEMIKKDIEDIDKFFTEAKWELEHKNVNMFSALHLSHGSLVGFMVHETLDGPGIDERLADVKGLPQPPVNLSQDVATATAREFGGVDSANVLNTSAADATEGTEGTEGTQEGGKKGKTPSPFANKDPDELLDMMTTDREAFWDKMGELGFEEQQFVMQKTQQRMQEINRMFSMMSNLTKSMHDTQKSVINNMRV